MSKVAVVKFYDFSRHSFDWAEKSGLIPLSITEWEEVTEEELKLLRDYVHSTGSYLVIEQISVQSNEVTFTIRDAIERQKKLEKKRQEDEVKRKIHKEKAKLAKIEKNRKLYESLKKEFEKDASTS